MPGYEKIESLKNGGSWGQFCWKTCGFERVNGLMADTLIRRGRKGTQCITMKPSPYSSSAYSHFYIGRNGSFFNVAGYLIEERRRWPVITASPRGQCSK